MDEQKRWRGYWQSTDGGDVRHGDLFATEDEARAWADYGNRTWPRVNHWYGPWPPPPEPPRNR